MAAAYGGTKHSMNSVLYRTRAFTMILYMFFISVPWVCTHNWPEELDKHRDHEDSQGDRLSQVCIAFSVLSEYC